MKRWFKIEKEKINELKHDLIRNLDKNKITIKRNKYIIELEQYENFRPGDRFNHINFKVAIKIEPLLKISLFSYAHLSPEMRQKYFEDEVTSFILTLLNNH